MKNGETKLPDQISPKHLTITKPFTPTQPTKNPNLYSNTQTTNHSTHPTLTQPTNHSTHPTLNQPSTQPTQPSPNQPLNPPNLHPTTHRYSELFGVDWLSEGVGLRQLIPQLVQYRCQCGRHVNYTHVRVKDG